VSIQYAGPGQKRRVPDGPGPDRRGRAGSLHALLIVAMSSDRLFLNGMLASIARLRFTGIISVNLLPLRRESFTIER
jgi:hypothetical protein